MYKKLLKLAAWKKVLVFVVLGLVIFVGWFVYEIITDEPPHFIPLNDPQAEYRIIKGCPNAQGWGESKDFQGNAYCLEYRGDNVLMKEEHNNSEFFTITIGKSSMDLQPYEGKKVINIKGRYTSSDTQCIQNTCTKIGGPFVVVNITHIELAQ